MAIARRFSVLSAVCLLLVSGLAVADETSVQAGGASALQAGERGGAAGRGPGGQGPEIARWLLQASLDEIEKRSSLAAATQNIRETLDAARQASREARAALDEALGPQLRNGQIDEASLASLVSSAEQAAQAERVALVQALDDARSLLSDEQRAAVVAAVKAKLAQGRPGDGEQPPGASGEQPGASGPPSGEPGGQPPGGRPPPGAAAPEAASTSAGSATSSADASSERLARDPLLAGITLTDAQKQALISLGYLGDEDNGGSIQSGPPQRAPRGGPSGAAPSGPPPQGDARSSGASGGQASEPGPPGSELLEAFVSDADELALPEAPSSSGRSPLAERVRRLAILAEVLDTEQRGVLAARLTAEGP